MRMVAITLHCMHGTYIAIYTYLEAKDLNILIVLANSFMICIWRIEGCQMFVMLTSFENGSIN